MKKVTKILAVVMVIAVITVGLVGCLDNSNKKDGFTLSNSADILSTALVSSANILSGLGTDVQKLSTQQVEETVDVLETPDVTDAEINDIHSQIQMFETFIGENPLSVAVEASDREQYEHKMTIKFKDITGEEVGYVLYYNQTLNVDDDDDDDEDGDDVFDIFEIDKEQEYSLTGILVVGENEYSIFGEKEHEGNEYELNIIAKIDDNNYIVIEQESEADEQELLYQVWKDGKKVTSFSLSLEEEKGETSVKIKSTVDGQTTYRKFSKEVKGNETVIKIKQTIGNENYEVKVKITIDANGEEVYTYTTQSGKQIIKNK